MINNWLKINQMLNLSQVIGMLLSKLVIRNCKTVISLNELAKILIKMDAHTWNTG